MHQEEGALESGDSLIMNHGRVEEDVACMSTARSADALLRLVEEGVSAGPNPLSGPERVQVILHVPVGEGGSSGADDAATFAGEPANVQRCTPPDAEADDGYETGTHSDHAHSHSQAHAPEPEPEGAIPNPARTFAAHAQLDPGGVVPMATARRLACDASCVEHHENDRGETVSIGRRSRTVPTSMRRALQHRDGGCCFPGCTQRHYVDAHHIHHWAEGGETSLDNLVLLCRRHHRLVHEEGFACERTAQGQILFRMPDGALLSEAFRLQPGSFPDIADINAAFGLNISAETCDAGWDGRHMDLSMAVEQLWVRTHGPGPFPLPPRRKPKDVPYDPSLDSGPDGAGGLLWTPVFSARDPH